MLIHDLRVRGQLTQQSIDAFTVKKPVNLPVTKQGIQEHMLAIIATCDLVSFCFINHFNYIKILPYTQSFRFVERPAVRRFILYLNRKLTDGDIPHKSTMAESVNKKVVIVEETTRKLIKVSTEIPILPTSVLDSSKLIGHSFPHQCGLGRLDNKKPPTIQFCQYILYPFSA